MLERKGEQCDEEEVQPYRKTDYKPIIYPRIYVYLSMYVFYFHMKRKIFVSGYEQVQKNIIQYNEFIL